MRTSNPTDHEVYPNIQHWDDQQFVVHEFPDGWLVVGSNRAELHLFGQVIIWDKPFTYEQAEILCNLLRYYRVTTQALIITDLRVLFSGV